MIYSSIDYTIFEGVHPSWTSQVKSERHPREQSHFWLIFVVKVLILWIILGNFLKYDNENFFRNLAFEDHFSEGLFLQKRNYAKAFFPKTRIPGNHTQYFPKTFFMKAVIPNAQKVFWNNFFSVSPKIINFWVIDSFFDKARCNATKNLSRLKNRQLGPFLYMEGHVFWNFFHIPMKLNFDYKTTVFGLDTGGRC